MKSDSNRVKIACLGFVFDKVAQGVIRQVAPAHVDLTFAERNEDVTPQMIAESDVLFTVAPVTDEMMRNAPRLRLIQKWGTGYEKIDTAAAARHGITVAITAGIASNTVAEHAITLMLTAMRNVLVADRSMREGRWITSELRPISQRLYGKTVGIVGFGGIGRALARQLRGFDATTLYYRRSGQLANDADFGATYVGLDELFARSDVVSIHVPGGAANRGMIGAGEFARMKRGAVFINVARGEIVVEADLVEALRSGQLSAAGLDVFAEEPLRQDSPLRKLPNVVLTPHAAGSLMDDLAMMASHAFENVVGFLHGERIRPADLIVDPEKPRAALAS